jgi:hypothetical protein
MQGRHILLVVLLFTAIVAGGCTAPDEIANAESATPPPSPAPTEVQPPEAVPAPTPAAPVRANTAAGPLKLEFVDPRTYHIPTPTPTIAMTRQPDDLRVSEKMVEYAKATIDYPPGVLATEAYHIPFPYWELGLSATTIDEHPWLSVEIYEKDDPNRAVQMIQFFQFERAHAGNATRGSTPTWNSTADSGKSFTIREGYGDFYFIARSGALKSLSLTIRVPDKYLV